MKRLFDGLAQGPIWIWSLLLVTLLFASCDGENLFETGGTGNGNRSGPLVSIQSPDSGQRVAVGDSVLVRFEVSDEQGVASIELAGYALTGRAELGTLTATQRFATKTINLDQTTALVRDTSFARYLQAQGDSVAADSVIVVATATDRVGNVGADTVRISIGGPRVQIVSPRQGAEIRPGATLLVRLAAADSANRIQEVRLAASGGFATELLVRLEPPVARVDTTVAISVPAGAPTGQVRLLATAVNTVNDSTLSAPVTINVLPPAADTQAPQVEFSVSAPTRAEQSDSIQVTVSAEDDIRVDRVGVTLLAIHRLSTGTDTLSTTVRTADAGSATFRVSLRDLNVPFATDSSTVRIETTAFAFDSSENCASATVPDTELSEPCVTRNGAVFGSRAGAFTELLLVRGATARPRMAGDRFADLTVDQIGRRVFVTNFTRNRVELLPWGAESFTDSIPVGSEPWGITVGVNLDTLFVANSGGTNISVIPLATLVENEANRIRPPDIHLYGVQYDVVTDSVDAVTDVNYSDRPQFVGQISSGQLIYSTRPTETAASGTIRIIDPAKDQRREFNRASEIFIDYASTESGSGIVVNALVAGLTTGRALTVCPRSVTASGSDPACITGTATAVSDSLRALRNAGLTDTRLDLSADIQSIPLTDTTFVAVSRDNSTVAFGEGAVDPGRVFLFQDIAGSLIGSSRETRDLLGNAAEQVIGLALNGDGTLGAARGDRAYFFDEDLRQEGETDVAGVATGGIAIHPANTGYPGGVSRLSFVSAATSSGLPYIDIVDTFSFRSIRKVFIRDRIVGTLAAALVPASDPEFGEVALRLFGITTTGVIEIELSASDLQ